MLDRGELRTWPGRVTPAGFVSGVGGRAPRGRGRRRLLWRIATGRARAMDALDSAGVGWPVEWRAQGSGKDGIGRYSRLSTGGRGWLASARRIIWRLAAAIRESEVQIGITTGIRRSRRAEPTRTDRRAFERGRPGDRRGLPGSGARGRGFILSHPNFLRKRK